MAINWIRGFRRIGWVVTFPLMALIIFVFYDSTKEFSASNYGVKQVDWFEANAPDIPAQYTIARLEDPSYGEINFSYLKDVPEGVVSKIMKDFLARQKPNPGPWQKHQHWRFTVHREVNRVKLIGLIIGAFACVALVIQGSISILAWILRGFKGTSHIDAS
jgi:hypothetical protein